MAIKAMPSRGFAFLEQSSQSSQQRVAKDLNDLAGSKKQYFV